MHYMLIQHEVQQVNDWLDHFSAKGDVRREYGEKSMQLFRKEENPQMLFLILEWDSLERARVFSESADFHTLMNHANPIGRPTVLFLHGQSQSAMSELFAYV